MSSVQILFARSVAVVGLTFALSACGHPCGLGLHDTEMVTQTGDSDRVPCCGGFVTKDLALLPETDGEVDITNVLQYPEPVDAFLVPTTCTRLFDGAYPGSQPLCQVYAGPIGSKSASGRVKLNQGTYRLWMQADTANTDTSGWWVSIDILDYRCVPIIR